MANQLPYYISRVSRNSKQLFLGYCIYIKNIMKTKLLIYLLFVGFGLSTSCESDDNDLPQEKTIIGTWNLINVRGGLASISKNYANGDVKWTFNQTDSTLSVQNKIGNDDAFMLLSGLYTFAIEQHGKTQVLFANNKDYRMVILSMDNNLIISDDMNDGFTAEFKR